MDEREFCFLNDAEYFKNKYLNPTDEEEIMKHAPHLTKCALCLNKLRNRPYQRWFVTEDMRCCICETCYNDFKETFHWKKLDGWDIDWSGENI